MGGSYWSHDNKLSAILQVICRFLHGASTTGDTVDNAKVMAKGQIAIPKSARAAIMTPADFLLY